MPSDERGCVVVRDISFELKTKGGTSNRCQQTLGNITNTKPWTLLRAILFMDCSVRDELHLETKPVSLKRGQRLVY